MRRPFVISTGALALALLPAIISAQTPQPTAQQPTTQQPTGQPPATQPPAGAEQAKPAEPPKVPFTTPAGALLVQIKPDQTAVFEEMVSKLQAGLAQTQDATLKQQASGFKVYKATEPLAGNALYVIFIEPTVPSADYELFVMLQKAMTKEELSSPATQEMWKRYVAAFAAGLNKLSLTPVGKGM
jgi:hypothetical protein